MQYFLLFVSYTQQAWEVLVRSPQNRVDLVRPIVEDLGGKIESGFVNLANYEAVAIISMPNNVNMAALSMAFLSQFAVKSVNSIPLLTWDEAIAAMQKARSTTYKPPQENPMLDRQE
jgi:uncharacterized protein with GYD domain